MAKVTGVNIFRTAVGELMRSPEMEAEMVRRGEKVFDLAVARAPVAHEGQHPGRYKESFHLEHGAEGMPGAVKLDDRAWCEVYNDAPEALYVEYGDKGAEPYHVLLKALVEGSGD
jgi:hypothetical protein